MAVASSRAAVGSLTCFADTVGDWLPLDNRCTGDLEYTYPFGIGDGHKSGVAVIVPVSAAVESVL